MLLRTRALILLLVGAAALHADSRTYHLPYVVNGGGSRTTLVLANPSAATVDVTIATTDPAGLPATATLAAGETRTLDTDSSGPRTEIAARIDAPRPIAVLATIGSMRLGAAPVLRSFFVPVEPGTARRTTVALSNPASQAVAVRLRLLDAAGRELAAAVREIGAGGRLAFTATGDDGLFPAPEAPATANPRLPTRKSMATFCSKPATRLPAPVRNASACWCSRTATKSSSATTGAQRAHRSQTWPR